MKAIVTERLVLRLLQAHDVPAFAAYRSDPDVARHQSWDASYTVADGERLVAAQQGVDFGDPGSWVQIAAVERATGALCGDCAVRVVDDQPRTAEVGVTFAPAYQGTGLATEALAAVITRLFAEHDMHRVYAQADDRNVAVHRLLERLGFRCEARLVEADWFKGEWTTLRTYAILRREWRMSGPALIVVDVQKAFDDPSWGRRNNPDCERNIALLIDHWRATGDPIVFVRHDSDEPGSTLAPGSPGHAFKDVIAGAGDLLVTKSVNSSFHGEPSLQAWLDSRRIDTLYVCGITTNHCCETTARVGGNLGYDVRFVLDATHTFDRADPAGEIVTADELARVTATNLHGEFATVIDTATAIGPSGAGVELELPETDT